MTKQSKKPIKTVEAKPAEAVETTPETTAEPAPKITKKALVEHLLTSEKGATIEELAKQTGWQAHTVRGHLSILKKAGAEIISERIDGARRYRIVKTNI
jgi:DNA-binding transcriptional ArsR family regulator